MDPEATTITTPAPAPATPPVVVPAAAVTQPDATPAAPAGAPKGEPDAAQRDKRLADENKSLKATLDAINARLGKLDGADTAAAQTAVTDTKADIEALNEQHASDAKRWAVEKALLTAGCIDADAALAHVDMAAVDIAKDGHLSGLDAAKVKEAYPYLFQAAEPAAIVSTGAAAAGAPGAKPATSIAEGVAAAFKQR